MTAANRWFHRPHPVPAPAVRLVCFPYAGRAGTMYRPWAALLPAGVELVGVNLPGRESRSGEPLPDSLDELATRIAGALRPLLATTPAVFFGHSLGAILAYEVSHRLPTDGGDQPRCLVVSGCRAPQLGPATGFADLPDEQLVAQLRRLNGTAEAILTNPAALALFLPVVRADFRLVETYTYRERGPLPCPIVALAGTHDPETGPAEMAGWRQHSTAGFALRRIPGDHFFLDSARSLVVAAVTQALLPELVR